MDLSEKATRHGYRLFEHDGLFDVYDEERKEIWVNAPKDDVEAYLSWHDWICNRIVAAAWNGLSPESYNVIGILWHENKPMILMRSKQERSDPTPYCVEYRGSGHYFHDMESMGQYIFQRLRK